MSHDNVIPIYTVQLMMSLYLVHCRQHLLINRIYYLTDILQFIRGRMQYTPYTIDNGWPELYWSVSLAY